MGWSLCLLFWSGDLQGCPPSGSLLVIAIWPLAHMFKIQLESSSLVWVGSCADVIGMAVSQWRHPPIAQTLCTNSNKCLSGLDLKAVNRL